MNEKAYLLKKLPPFSNKQILIKAKQEIPDIVNEVLDAHDEFLEDYLESGEFFNVGNNLEIAQSLFDFCKKNIRYKVENENEQTTKSPAAILTTGCGDCKHYAGFIAGNLDAISKLTGRKIDWFYRFASYKLSDKEPGHVFVVMRYNNNEIWIDPVLHSFNSRSVTPKSWIDYKINNNTMSLKRISGINQQVKLQNSIQELKYYGILDNTGNVNASNYVRAMAVLPAPQAQSLSNSLDYIKTAITNPAAIGSVFGDVLSALSTVFGGGSSSSQTQQLQQQLANAQAQLALANEKANSINQYIPLLLIGGVAIIFLMKK